VPPGTEFDNRWGGMNGDDPRDRDQDPDDTPDTPLDEPAPVPVQDPPAEPDQKGPYITADLRLTRHTMEESGERRT